MCTMRNGTAYTNVTNLVNKDLSTAIAENINCEKMWFFEILPWVCELVHGDSLPRIGTEPKIKQEIGVN